MKITTILTLAASLLMTTAGSAAESSESTFKKDRAAILGMAGKYKVDFNFYETFQLSKDYELIDEKYHEEAHELVVVTEDTGERIVLQHLLQFKRGEKDHVVKHWSQIWTFQDTEILEYQKEASWLNKTLASEQVQGTWSQLVTQVDESPRYESYAKWQHTGDTSQWVSQETPRPLPRREYTERDDYDVLVALNIQLVSPAGWVHEQSNRKLVKRDGVEKFLCQERGYNTYVKQDDHDFKVAQDYWKDHGKYWMELRKYWDSVSAGKGVTIQDKYDGNSLQKATRKLMKKATEAEGISEAEIQKLLGGFTAKN